MRYGRTHMWFGVHLLVLLLLAVSLGLKASLLVAWANILAILSLLAAPFWFNPFSLDWQTNKVGSWGGAVLAVLLGALEAKLPSSHLCVWSGPSRMQSLP